MEKPDINFWSEPVLIPLRRSGEGMNWFQRFFLWRMGRRHWQLVEDWIIYVDFFKCWVKIPAGFVFDGASVPKIFNSIVNSTDALFYGSIIHDFIYRFAQLIICTDDDFGRWCLAPIKDKHMADSAMLHLSIQAEGIKTPSQLAYFILKYLGCFAWRKSRKMGFELTDCDPDPKNEQLNYWN